MKRILLLLMIATTFVACSKDEELKELELTTETAVLTVGESFQIEATSDYGITYSMMDGYDYSASVTESGLVNANKVGVSTVNVESNGKIEPFVVAVVGEYFTYPEPSIEWGWSKTMVKDSMEWTNLQLSMYGSDGFIKKNFSSNAPYAIFRFDDDDILKSYIILVKPAYILEATNFLIERYYTQGTTDEWGFFIDAKSDDDATTVIGLNYEMKTYNNESVYQIIYVPKIDNKSISLKNAMLH